MKNVDSLTVIDKIHGLTFEQLTMLYRLCFSHRVNETFDPVVAESLAKLGFIQKTDDKWQVIKGLIDPWNGTAQELNDLWIYKNEAEVNKRIQQERKTA